MKKYLLATLTFWVAMANSGKCQTIDTLIDVGGYRLHFHIIKGKGMPILFEGGAGADVSVWDIILKPIADITHATLITYDRAGSPIGQTIMPVSVLQTQWSSCGNRRFRQTSRSLIWSLKTCRRFPILLVLSDGKPVTGNLQKLSLTGGVLPPMDARILFLEITRPLPLAPS